MRLSINWYPTRSFNMPVGCSTNDLNPDYPCLGCGQMTCSESGYCPDCEDVRCGHCMRPLDPDGFCPKCDEPPMEDTR